MNLAWNDVRRNVGRFLGTSVGIALLFTVVLAMAGIYQGLVDEATIVLQSAHADLWIVEEGTRGPFADVSRLDPSLEARVAAVPGVTRARSFTYQVIERREGARTLRFALLGVSYPEDRARALPIIAGRPLEQAHGELVADASLGVSIGEVLHLGGEELRVVGLTKNLLGASGDGVLVATVADAQLIVTHQSSDAVRTERERRTERLLATDLGQSQPALGALVADPRWTPPVLAPPPVAAILVDAPPERRADVMAAIGAWADVSVYSSEDEEGLLLQGLVDKARRQLGLFSVILVLTSSVLIAAVVYTMTLDKTHSIAVLKLIGAPPSRIAGMVLQQAWLMGIVGYALAVAIGTQAFPHFPRRVVLTTTSIAGVGALVLVVSTLASLLGVAHALRVDAGKALGG